MWPRMSQGDTLAALTDTAGPHLGLAGRLSRDYQQPIPDNLRAPTAQLATLAQRSPARRCNGRQILSSSMSRASMAWRRCSS